MIKGSIMGHVRAMATTFMLQLLPMLFLSVSLLDLTLVFSFIIRFVYKEFVSVAGAV